MAAFSGFLGGFVIGALGGAVGGWFAYRLWGAKVKALAALMQQKGP